MIVTTVERIEDMLGESGFMSSVPVDEKLYAAGDGDVIEDAPIGYYRFHFWKTDEAPKEHDNYLAITKEAGPVCISVIRGSSGTGGYYRLLIRTIFGFKSMILNDEVLATAFANTQLSTHQLMTIAMHHYVGNEREKTIFGGPVDDDDAASMHSNMTGMSTRTDRTRFLPHSRLKSLLGPRKSSPNSGEARSLDARSDSIRRVSSPSQSPLRSIPEDDTASVYCSAPVEESLAHQFRAFSKMKSSDLAKTFVKIEESSLPQTLLAMENSLAANKLDVDVIRCGAGLEKNWETFCHLMGSHIEPGLIMQQRLRSARDVASIGNAVEPSPKMASMSFEEAAKLQAHPVNDLVEKEINYSKQLDDMDRWFVQELGQRKSSVTPYQFNRMFGNIGKLARLHREMLKTINVRLPDGRVDVESMCRGLIQFLRHNKEFRDTYQYYCNQQCDREVAFKDEYATNQSFYQFCEDVYAKRVFHLAKLDQLLMGPVQRMTRYKMHLEEIIKSTHPDDEALPLLKEAFKAAQSLALFIDSVVEQQRGLEQLCLLASRIKGLPANFVSGDMKKRFFVAQLEVTEATKHGGEYTLFLFNDSLILAQNHGDQKQYSSTKRNKKKGGIVERSQVVGQREMVIGAPLKDLKLSLQGKYIEFSLLNEEALMLNGSGSKDYRLLYKFASTEASLDQFLSAYTTLRTDQETKDSPAQIFLAGDFSPELYFHVFQDAESYAAWPHKQPIVLLFVDGVEVPRELVSSLGNQAVGVVQAKAEAFRQCLKYRGLLCTSENSFAAARDFNPPASFRTPLIKSVINCGRLLEIYPPFSRPVERQRKQQLESLAMTYGDSLKYKLKSFTSFAGKWRSGKSKTARGDADDFAQKLWDDSMSYLAGTVDNMSLHDEEYSIHSSHASQQEEPAETPRSVFGSPLGRKKSENKPSPLAARASPLKTTTTNFDNPFLE